MSHYYPPWPSTPGIPFDALHSDVVFYRLPVVDPGPAVQPPPSVPQPPHDDIHPVAPAVSMEMKNRLPRLQS